MAKYYVNVKEEGRRWHIVHTEGCQHLSHEGNRFFLGEFKKGQQAVEEAEQYFPEVGGCKHCMGELY